ncbi:hypothetical protein ACEN8K_40825, partial [Variovorax sp. CT11-76]
QLFFDAPTGLINQAKAGKIRLIGVAVLVAAKLAGTAVVARIFQLVEGTLMRIPLFARWYPRWKAWKDRVLGLVRQSRPWRLVHAFNRRALRAWRRLRGV